MQIRQLALLVACIGLGACGSVSGLKREVGASDQINTYSQVEVLDFAASGGEHFTDATKQAQYDASLVEARKDFADRIAEAVRATSSFETVSRQPLPGRVLRVSGDITRYDEGNLAARGLTGFAGQTHFEAKVLVIDGMSGQTIASIDVDRNSWPLPVGASASILQTTNSFMKGAAKKVADELLAARATETGH